LLQKSVRILCNWGVAVIFSIEIIARTIGQ